MAASVPHRPNKYFHVTASNGTVSNSPYTPLAITTASPSALVRVFDPRCRCRLVTFAALPTPSMIERAIILLTDQRFWGHASGPSSSGKTLPCSIHCWHGHAARRSALPRERFRPLALNRSGGSGERPLCTKTGRICEGVSQLERDVGRLANVSLGLACTLRSDGTRISTASDDRDS